MDIQIRESIPYTKTPILDATWDHASGIDQCDDFRCALIFLLDLHRQSDLKHLYRAICGKGFFRGNEIAQPWQYQQAAEMGLLQGGKQ
jgi:hypothetical protein